jgi:hypothetical protein
LAYLLNERPGVIEHGLFINMAHEVIVATNDGIKCFRKDLESMMITEAYIPLDDQIRL